MSSSVANVRRLYIVELHHKINVTNLRNIGIHSKQRIATVVETESKTLTEKKKEQCREKTSTEEKYIYVYIKK